MAYFDRLGAAYTQGVPLGTAQGIADASKTRAEAANQSRFLAGQAFFGDNTLGRMNAQWAQNTPEQQASIKAQRQTEALRTDPLARASQFAEDRYDQAVAAGGRQVARGLSAAQWFMHNVIEPGADYYEAANRNYMDTTQASKERGFVGGFANIGAMLGFIPGVAFTDKDFRDHYYPQARENQASIANVAWELASYDDRGNYWDEATQRHVLPLIDDPAKRLEREEYFRAGPQRWITGIADAVLSTALDPTIVAGGVVGGAARSLRAVGAADITASAATSRGAAVAAADAAEAAARGAGVAEDAIPGVRQAAMDKVRTRPETIVGRRLQHNFEKVTDALWDARGARVADEAGEIPGAANVRPGMVARAANAPGINRAIERGSLADAMRYIASTYSDEAVAKGFMDDVLHAAAGDRAALARMHEKNQRLALDFQAMMQTDRHAAEQAILADARLTTAQKLHVLHNDDLFEARADVIRNELGKFVTDLVRVEKTGTNGLDLDKVGALGAAGQIDRLPLTAGIRRGVGGLGEARIIKTIRVFQSTTPVHVIAGKRMPGTLNLVDDQAEVLFDSYLRQTRRVWKRGEKNDPMWDTFRDDFFGARTGLDPDLARAQRQDIIHHVDSIAQRKLVSKYARLHGVDEAEVQAWISKAMEVRRGGYESFKEHARRAVQMDRDGVWRDIDGNWHMIPRESAKQFSGAHTQGSMAMIDWRRMDLMLKQKFKPGMVSSPKGRQELASSVENPLRSEWAPEALNGINEFWKFGVLLRPAYFTRNQMDAQFRTIATAGALEYGLMAVKGIKNYTVNHTPWLSRVQVSDIELLELKRRAMREHDGLENALMKYDPALIEDVRHHGMKAPTTRPIGTPKAITDGTSGKAVAVQERAATGDRARIQEILEKQRELEQTIEMPKNRWEAMIRGDGYDPKSLGTVKRSKTVAKKVQGSSEGMDFKTGKYTPNEWDDAYPRGYEDLAEKILPNAEESVFGLLEAGRRNVLRRESFTDYSLVEYGTSKVSRETWANAYAEAINRDIRNDKSMMMMLLGASDQDIIRWMRDPLTDGPEYWAARKGGFRPDAPPQWSSPEELLAAQHEHLDNLVPNREAADLVIGRDVDVDDVAGWYKDGDTRPLVPAESIHTIGKPRLGVVTGAYENTRSKYFHLMSTLPEGMMGRHPTYMRLYQNHIRRLAGSVGRPGKALNQVELRNLQKRADILARRDMTDIVFDTSHASNMAYHVRFLSQFWSAWADTMRKWGRIFAEHPIALPVGYRMFESTTSALVTLDDEGRRIMPDGTVRVLNEDGSTGEIVGENLNPMSGKLVFHLPEWMQGLAGTDAGTISRGSLNAIFQGETPYLPPTGPLVVIPINEILSEGLPFLTDEQNAWVTSQSDNPVLEKWLTPFGQTDASVTEQSSPSWARAMFTAIKQDGPQYAQTYSRLMGDEIHRQEMTGDHLSGPETRQKVANQARNWWWLRFAGTWALPASTAPQSKLDWYITKFREYQAQGSVTETQPDGSVLVETAEDRFMRDFPDYGEVIIETSFNETGIAATEAAWREVQPWRKEIAHAPEIGWMFAGDANYTGEFSDAVYTAQKRQKIAPGSSKTFRRNLGQEEAFDQISEDKGWREWSSFNDMIDERLTQLGLASLYSNAASELRDIRDEFLSDLSERNPTWATAYQGGTQVGPNPVGDFLNKAYGALSRNPDLVAKRQDLRTLNDYLGLREEVRQQMLAMGFRSAEGDAFKQTPLFQEWQAIQKEMRDYSPAFGELYTRARLDRDNLNSEVVAY